MTVDQQLKRHYQSDDIAAGYDAERFSSVPGRLFDALEKRALRRAVRRVRQSIACPRTLDIPCGTGRITELLLADGLHVLGGDISTAMIGVARAKCARFGDRASFRRLDLDDLELPDASYDLVTCIRLLHHLDAPARGAVLKAIGRVSARFAIVNYSVSTPYYRARRRLKRLMGQGVSRTSATWAQIAGEAAGAGLAVRRVIPVLPLATEDHIFVLEKRGQTA